MQADAVSFGPFILSIGQHALFKDDKPVHLGSRAFEILVALVERTGELVTKEELLARIWPNVFVGEANLRVHIAALRKALGDGQGGNRFINTTPGRGYRFVAKVTPMEGRGSFHLDRPPKPQSQNVPAPLTRMVGRDEIVARLVGYLTERRLVTLVGSGGVGKTTVALEVAHQLITTYPDAVRFIDLGPISKPWLVATALASSLGLEVRSETPISDLVAFLREKEMLLVFDGCEPVVDAAAALVEQVLLGAPGVRILTTSREPLRAGGECLHRLQPLKYPPTSSHITSAEALSFPAIQLFVERTTAAIDEFELTDELAPAVAEICRRLDGIPLAIELAAGRVDGVGIKGLLTRLDDQFRILTGGLRTALPRHKTLSAMIEWSYELLQEDERAVLRALSVCVGPFSPEAANAIVPVTGVEARDVDTLVAALVAKSLVTADIGGAIVLYRLLDTTRSYTFEKLKESEHLELCARRHAEYFGDALKRAGAEWNTSLTLDWLATYAHQIDNVRTALDWASSPNGDVKTFVALVIAAVPLWLQLSLLDECHMHVDEALSALGPETSDNLRQRMQLTAAFGVTLTHKFGPGPSVNKAWASVLDSAELLNDADYKLRALWGLWVANINGGQYRAALTFAQEFNRVATEQQIDVERHIGHRLIGNTLYYLGDHAGARWHIEEMRNNYVAPASRSHVVRYQFDQRMASGVILARILWAQGFPDQALKILEDSLNEALASGHALSICIALALGMCPIALEVGDLDLADRSVKTLFDYSKRHSLAYWLAWSHAFRGVLQIKRGEIASGLRILGETLEKKTGEPNFAQNHIPFLAEFAGALCSSKQTAKALSVIDAALDRCERDDGRWYFAELLRVKAQIVLRDGKERAAEEAEKYFLLSLDWARKQKALSWELRTITSLARLRCDQKHNDEARDLLKTVYAKFVEGWNTTDLKAARTLLDELS